MYKKILVPLDGSEVAQKALEEAEKLAKIFDSELLLVQIVPFMPIYGSPELVTPLIIDEKQKEAAHRYLASLVETFEAKRIQGYAHGQNRPTGPCRNHRRCQGEGGGSDRDE